MIVDYFFIGVIFLLSCKNNLIKGVFIRIYPLILLLFIITGCSSTPGDNKKIEVTPNDVNSANFQIEIDQNEPNAGDVNIADPLEGINRVFFGINDVIYSWIINPVGRTWKVIVPEPVRFGIRNFFSNVSTPVRLVNCLLQGKNQSAGQEFNRFCINTTIGVLGFGDPAKDQYGLKPTYEDLGQSLAKFGFDSGPYLVLPLMGPSTVRDLTGAIGDSFLNPVHYVEPHEVAIGFAVTRGVNGSSFYADKYDLLKKTADPYVVMRRAYIRYRINMIKDINEPAGEQTLFR